MSEPVDQKTLETFVSHRYHWKSLLPHEQESMASELLKHRFMEKQLLTFISEYIDDKNAMRKYRELISNGSLKETD